MELKTIYIIQLFENSVGVKYCAWHQQALDKCQLCRYHPMHMVLEHHP
jgi:hypothetical protein